MSDDQLPEGTLVEVKMTVLLPVAATKKQINDWLNHNIAHQGSISDNSPLYSEEPTAWGLPGLEWRDTGEFGRTEEFDHEDLGGGQRRWRVRYLRERRT